MLFIIVKINCEPKKVKNQFKILIYKKMISLKLIQAQAYGITKTLLSISMCKIILNECIN